MACTQGGGNTNAFLGDFFLCFQFWQKLHFLSFCFFLFPDIFRGSMLRLHPLLVSQTPLIHRQRLQELGGVFGGGEGGPACWHLTHGTAADLDWRPAPGGGGGGWLGRAHARDSDH